MLAAHRRTWARLACPGTWWTAAERVAIASEVRQAPHGTLCRERKQALSPSAVAGEHTRSEAVLPAAAVDVVHRIVTDPARLSKEWFASILASGLSDGHYVELIGVLVSVVSIDSLHRGLGLTAEPLPAPGPGEPSRRRPPGAGPEGAWVAMIAPDKLSDAERDLWSDRRRPPNVRRALSLVPDEVRRLQDLSGAHYLEADEVPNPRASGGRALSRPQMELVAGRVSVLNERARVAAPCE